MSLQLCRLIFAAVILILTSASFAIRSAAEQPIIKFSEVVKFNCYPPAPAKTLFDDRTNIVKIKNKFYLNGTIEFMHRLTQRQFTYVTVATIPHSSRTIDYYNFCLFMSHEEFALFPLLQHLKHCPLRQSDEWKFNMIPIKFSRHSFLQHFRADLGIWGLQIIFHQETNRRSNGTETRENCMEFRGTFSLQPSKLKKFTKFSKLI